MSQKTRFTQSALAVAVALVSTQAWSAGFQLNEFSASGLGRAYSAGCDSQITLLADNTHSYRKEITWPLISKLLRQLAR